MLTFIGLCVIFTVVVLLLTEKTTAAAALILVPFIGALLAGFSLGEIGKFYTSGTRSVMQIAIMFIFAIIFFGVMNDVGLFNPFIEKLVALSKGNVVAVAVGTVIISTIAQLDGAGASTFLLVVPALLPLYKHLKMNPYLLFLLLAASAGVVNMLPWGGPTGRVATVLHMDVAELYQPLIIVQVIGLITILAVAVLLGFREKHRIAKEYGSAALDSAANSEIDVNVAQANSELARPKLIWVNALLFVVTLAVLVSAILPSAYVFMIATVLALLINFRTPKEQGARIQAHAGGAIMMASIIISAGTFLGILKESGMLNSIAQDLVTVLPESMLPYLHIIIGLLGVPFELIFSTDAYYFGLLPIVEQITSQVGVAPTSTGYAMLIGSIVGTFISPFSPALWMGLGLANLSMGQHIRYSFFWIWGISIVTLLGAITLGIV